MTVYRTLTSSGLNRSIEKPRVKRTYIRWERKLPKPITILDDHSRFATGSQLIDEGTTENAIWLLDSAIHEYVKPREILTDHGSVFWSVRKGQSRFDPCCERHQTYPQRNRLTDNTRQD